MESKHFRQAIALLNESERQLLHVDSKYNECLKKQEIDEELLVVIKNFLENLRSALEYSAQGLNEKYGNCSDKSKISFPYANLSVTKDKFINNKYIERKIPGLTLSRPDIVNYIQSMQHFNDHRLKWFPVFIELTNTNKHIELTPHEKFEGVEMKFGTSSIIATGISGSSESLKNTITNKWDAFLINGVDWPTTAIEYLKHCRSAIKSAVLQMEQL